MASPPAKNHIPVLDGVRGLAILLVLGVHFCQSFLHQVNPKLLKIAILGQTGVDLFFVLSGFLITGILLDSKGTSHWLRNFFVRRMLRIVPLYYLALIVIYFVWPALHLGSWVPWTQSLWYWAYSQDIPWTLHPDFSGPNHFWSLAVEQHFYLIWPFLVLGLSRRNLLRAVVAAIAISLLSRVLLDHYDPYYFTLARLDSLSMGAAVAILARQPGANGLVRMLPWAKRALIAVVVAGAIGALLPPSFIPLTRVLRNTLIAAFYASALVLILENRIGPIKRVLSTQLMRSTGKYSYAMYIFHPFLFTWLITHGWMAYNAWSLPLGIVITYLAGWISWQLIEKPILNLKRYFEYDSKEQSRANNVVKNLPVAAVLTPSEALDG